jgi:hypothetical protein
MMSKKNRLDIILRDFGEEVADQFGGDIHDYPIDSLLESPISEIKLFMQQLIDQTFDKDDKKALELWEKIK